MQRRTRTLSIDDQKAVDVCLDHTATVGKTGTARSGTPVEQRRLASATKLLALLAELPAADPPRDLVARTMEKIDLHNTEQVGANLPAPAAISGTTPLH